MKLTLIPLAAGLVAVAVAGPIHDFEPSDDLSITNNTTTITTTGSYLTARGVKSMMGRCVRNDNGHEGACKVNLKKYPCLNSNCQGKQGEKCTVAHGTKFFEAKCPNNELSYEWEWPWKAPN